MSQDEHIQQLSAKRNGFTGGDNAYYEHKWKEADKGKWHVSDATHIERICSHLGHFQFHIQDLYEQCIRITQVKTTWDALLVNEDECHRKIGVRALRDDLDALAKKCAEFDKTVSAQLDALEQHLKSGLRDELKRLFEHHLAEIDKANEAKLAEMRSVATQAGEHQARALYAEQTATATGRNCEAIHEELKSLAARLREGASRTESEVANHLTIGKAETEKAKAYTEAASQLFEQHRQASATFWGRLRWLFCGPIS